MNILAIGSLQILLIVVGAMLVLLFPIMALIYFLIGRGRQVKRK